MKQDIAKEKSKIHDAKEELNSTIDELESFVMSLELGKNKQNGISAPNMVDIVANNNINNNNNNNNNDCYIVSDPTLV